MGETGQARRLSDAARGRAPGRLAARPALKAPSLKAFWRDDSGATAVELGLIIALIVLVVVAAMSAVTGGLSQILDKVSTTVGS
ncbi:Flp family type IVb pilin [Caulobacter sp. BP25]|uniref:Flp family type IVb pilin n=1 Tax=Caulobacter sp. BP25 TaxID=2048900 RepID=UPI000C12CA7D|nr:Flp family type IVb pilin [Caulobacter sp. BP25]